MRLAWYVGDSDLRSGKDPAGPPTSDPARALPPLVRRTVRRRRRGGRHCADHYDELRAKAARFSDCFYDTTLPPEVIEAVAANLTILKSPTVLRQADGRLWAWEGCSDAGGCCHGSCTHVWNYAQAVPHLFPALERTLRETEFGPSQAETGHQTFRSALPIRPVEHDFHAAADGQLGGILKVHRDWRISGDTEWLRRLWPKVTASLDYCIATWDPRLEGVLEEPHHNTYDIEFWGPDGMCTSFYLGALAGGGGHGRGARRRRRALRAAPRARARRGPRPISSTASTSSRRSSGRTCARAARSTRRAWWGSTRPRRARSSKKEGPKYQYGAGLPRRRRPRRVDGRGLRRRARCSMRGKVRSHLAAVHQHNLKKDLSEHANPQRPSFACGDEGGLLLCTWPKGGKLSLPFVYSNEVWTGIEYQVASHLMLLGLVDEGLEIVRAAATATTAASATRSTSTSAATGTRGPCRPTRCCRG